MAYAYLFFYYLYMWITPVTKVQSLGYFKKETIIPFAIKEAARLTSADWQPRRFNEVGYWNFIVKWTNEKVFINRSWTIDTYTLDDVLVSSKLIYN